MVRSSFLPSPGGDDERVSDVDQRARALMRRMLHAAIASADPAQVLPAHLPAPPKGRCVVVGAGKAAGSMAAAVEAAWPHVDLSGVVATPYGYGLPCRRVTVRESGHPVPDANSVDAAREILAAVQGLGPEDMVLALISGGGSAAMCLPIDGISLQDKRLTNKLLLASGLDIRTMNAVRRRISAIKGGKLAAAAAPARVVTLAISDIPGDDPTAIASGPTALGARNIDLRDVVERLGPRLPANVAALLSAPPEPSNDEGADGIRLIATPAAALEAAAAVARAEGFTPVILGDAIEGESRHVAEQMAARATPAAEPIVLISGGETTVTIGQGGAGRGGRNTEFALSLACALDGRAGIWALAADTDGEDGASLGAAGAVSTPDTLRRARAKGVDPATFLAAHDSGTFFEELGDLVVTGPTRTNINDFRAILVTTSAHW